MKNISIKIALAGVLLVNMASVSSMGRVSARLGKVVEKFTKQQIKALNEDNPQKAFMFFSKKRYAESVLEVLHKRVKEGVIPTREQLAELDHYSWKANHGVLNLAGDGGHTLLKDALHLPDSPARRKLLKALYDRGAELNARDIFVMGPEKYLKAHLNVPMDASAWTTVKVYRTFLTKNTAEKIARKFDSYKMTGLQVQKRLKKVDEVRNEYAKVEKDLLRERHFKFKDLR